MHGLGGNADNTWLDSNTKQDAWPMWLLEDCYDLNIWTVEYDAPKLAINSAGMGIPDLATNIFEHILKITELAEGEIIFICHSLGGLITKQILRLANDQPKRDIAQQFIGRVSGVAFLGTPHLGADIATHGHNLVSRALLRCLTLQKPSIVAASLSRNDPNLRELNTWYRDWCQYKTIRHIVLTETEKMYGIINVVKPDSADPGITGVRAIPIAVSHENICKPFDKSDDIYIHVKGFIAQKKREFNELWLASRFQGDNNSWQGVDNWVNSPEGVKGEYFCDDEIRLFDLSDKHQGGLSGLDGLNLVRTRLHEQKSPIRLVGLSGVGKTRFVQALFDSRIGENPLDHNAVFYTDIANGPKPTPQALTEKLSKEGRDCIIIIDNCPPELHRTMTSLCNKSEGKTNLITIEYDIREDQPEQTEVFTLEPSSIELIEKIINARYPTLGNQNSRTISEFSGGNSRIAIALAETIEKDENISSLKDEELFKRLFNQRHNDEKSLEKVAQALSLTYSFQFKADDGFSDDLNFISQLSEISPNELYQGAQELKRRNLVQQRSVWMAVLPHPLANRLAKLALENLNTAQLIKSYNETADERLLKSFSRRLGYLPESTEAKTIVINWLTDGGLIECLLHQGKNELAWILIRNIAPISTKEVLNFIESLTEQANFCTRENKQFITITRLLRSIAYKQEYFEQCSKILCLFALSEDKDENNNSIRSLFKSMFQLYLSGVHATKEQRLAVINELISTNGVESIELAAQLLDSSLEAWHFSSHHTFDFGSNSRDFGYHPQKSKEVEEWYKLYINFSTEVILVRKSIYTPVKTALSNNLRSLWHITTLRDSIESACNKISEIGMWREGFTAIHSILRFDCKESSSDEVSRLNSIADKLSPKSLFDEVNMYVLADKWRFYELDEMDGTGKVTQHGYRNGQEYARELGIKLANSDDYELLLFIKTLVSFQGTSSNLFEFGIGFAEGYNDNRELLNVTVDALSIFEKNERNNDFLSGQLNYLSKNFIDLTNEFLDSFFENQQLCYLFVLLQLSYEIDCSGVSRIIKSLNENISPLWMYRNLAFGRSHEPISDPKLCEIIDLILSKENGEAIAFEILAMRFHGLKQDGEYVPSNLIIEKSAIWLANLDYSKVKNNSGMSDNNLTQVAKICFSSDRNEQHAKSIFVALHSNFKKYIIGRYELPEFLSTLIQMYPLIALEEFLQGEDISYQVKEAIRGRIDKKVNPFSKVNIEDIITWCNEKPTERFLKVASIISPYTKKDDELTWSPLAAQLIAQSKVPKDVLDELASSLFPMSFTGSRAKIMESKLPLFQELYENKNTEIADWAKENKEKWDRTIEDEYEKENERDQQRNERFEW